MTGPRLAMVTNSYPFGDGEQFVKAELNALACQFSTIDVFPVEALPDTTGRSVPANVTVHKPLRAPDSGSKLGEALTTWNGPLLPWLREALAHPNQVAVGTRKRAWLRGLVDARLAWRRPELRSYLQDGQAGSAIYFYWGLPLTGIIASSRAKAAAVVRFHGYDLYLDRNEGYIPLRGQVACSAQHLVFVSRHGMDHFVDHYGNAERCRVMRLGTPDMGVGPDPNGQPVQLVSCARLVPLKRIPLLARALQQLDRPVCWTHFGDGPDRADLESACRNPRDGLQINLKGDVPHEQLLDWYRNHPVHMFVNASTTEGLPVSVMEAMSFGIPVLATDVGGTAELVSGDGGMLMPANIDQNLLAENLASAIDRVLASPEMRQRARRQWQDVASGETNNAAFARWLATVAADGVNR